MRRTRTRRPPCFPDPAAPPVLPHIPRRWRVPSRPHGLPASAALCCSPGTARYSAAAGSGPGAPPAPGPAAERSRHATVPAGNAPSEWAAVRRAAPRREFPRARSCASAPPNAPDSDRRRGEAAGSRAHGGQ
ncbi:uncharacterized PPE family protein PPE3-like [Gallus gallus]|uniref:uncharacterized PPE family protein PPE3-like n=1 Tax=Gallus gallus TaxID=9031 RepID=UPI001F01CD0E|nr:uncharacterized PPE family protein PPE3-like [Gallus gallus]XP_046799143.1 uncharacterized PPE family protein PPE3-like [Gallus gallus]